MMSQSFKHKKLILLTVLAANVLAVPALFAATNNSQGSGTSTAATNTATTTSAIVMQAADINFHPAPGFPKGAQIVLLRGDLSQAEPYTIRFKLPDGFVIPSHWHTTDEEVTVLSGTLNAGTGDTVDKSHSTALAAGSFAIVPAMLHHYVWATGETVMQLDGMGPRTTTFVNPQEWMTMIQKSNNS
ncbi:MAG: cupin domain-containing protein [Legionellales bacterium]|nr:cupin domain-containing protein [Legionellales bacterium]